MTGAPRNLPELALSRSALDRAGWRRKDEGLLDRLVADADTVVVELRGDRLMTVLDGSRLALQPGPVRREEGDVTIYLGEAEGRQHVGVVREAPAPERDDRWVGLRALGLALDPREVALACGLVGMAHWHRTHGFCPRCGEPSAPVQAGWVRRCPAGHESFPALSPAVIMAVTDEQDRLLLARNTGWPEGRMSVLAGFVEPGEALEAAVAREVAEEVGIQVEDVRYLGNQPWPFPASLMLAFTARARGTALTFRDREIAEARWFSRDELREAVRAGTVLSGGTPLSVAYHLIEHWLGESIADLAGRG